MLYRQCVSSETEKLDQLEFTQCIVNAYLQKLSIRSNPTGRKRSIASIPQDKRVLQEVRFDRMDHTIASIPKQRRCGQCGKKVSRQCAKCRVALHIDCFAAFHCNLTDRYSSEPCWTHILQVLYNTKSCLKLQYFIAFVVEMTFYYHVMTLS